MKLLSVKKARKEIKSYSEQLRLKMQETRERL